MSPAKPTQHLNSYIASECVSVVARKHILQGKVKVFIVLIEIRFFFSFSLQWDIFFVYFRQGNTLSLKDSPKFMCSWFGPGLVVLLKSDLIMLALRLSVDYWYKCLLGGGSTRSIYLKITRLLYICLSAFWTLWGRQSANLPCHSAMIGFFFYYFFYHNLRHNGVKGS